MYIPFYTKFNEFVHYIVSFEVIKNKFFMIIRKNTTISFGRQQSYAFKESNRIIDYLQTRASSVDGRQK